MQDYLICYDIFDKKRLYKVRKIVYSYALGGQKSALEAPLSKRDLKELITKLLQVIKPEDKINIIPFHNEPLCFGKGDFIKFEKGLIIV